MMLVETWLVGNPPSTVDEIGGLFLNGVRFVKLNTEDNREYFVNLHKGRGFFPTLYLGGRRL